MEDPERARAGNINDDEEEERRRRLEEMERIMNLQEQQEAEEEAAAAAAAANNDNADHHHPHGHGNHPDVPFHDDEAPLHHALPQTRKFNISYTTASFGAALGLLWYALRTRQQFFLALVFLSSSKYSYIILANAIIAVNIKLFSAVTGFYGGLRLVESEGLSDFFRWNVTETCLALTLFRSELDVQSGILFMFLILLKCFHYVASLRESHLRMTQDAIVTTASGNWPMLARPHHKLLGMLTFLICMDLLAVAGCIQALATSGPSVYILFCFESIISLLTALALYLLQTLHIIDGFLHYWHDAKMPGGTSMLSFWKDRKATLVFAIEVQTQGAKFLFYCAFFFIVMTYYGLPFNLFREVYTSFQALKNRLAAFAKYRKLVHSMNRFDTPTDEELDDGNNVCIICRDEMTVRDAKKLPECGHLFHTSCLREWLVQQQSCPTCRGDITANQARQEARRAREAAAAEQEDNGEAAEEADEETDPGEATEATPSTPNTSTWPSSSAARAKNHTASSPPPDKNRIFPALFKVTTDAPVYQNVGGDDDDAPFILRTIKSGSAIFCTELELQNVEDEFGLMLKIPDGWVWESQSEYLTHVS